MASPNSITVTPELGGSKAMDHPTKELLKLIFLLVTVACLWPALALFAFAVVIWSSINTLMLLVAKRFPQFCGKAVPAPEGSPSPAYLGTNLQEDPVLTSPPATLPFGLAPFPGGYQGFENLDLADTSGAAVAPALGSPDTAPGPHPRYTTSSTSEGGSHAQTGATHSDHPEPQGWLSGKFRDTKFHMKDGFLGDLVSGVRLKVRGRSLSEPDVSSFGEDKGGHDSVPSGELGKKNSTGSSGSTDSTQTEAFPMKRSGSYNQVVPCDESGGHSESHVKEGCEDSSGKSPEAWRKMTSAFMKPVSKYYQRKKGGS